MIMCLYSTCSRTNQARILVSQKPQQSKLPHQVFFFVLLNRNPFEYQQRMSVYECSATDRPTATINHLVNINNNFNHSELRRRAHMMNCILWMTIWVWVQLSAAANECEWVRVRISVFTWQSLLFYCDLLAMQKKRERERMRDTINAEQQSAHQEQQQKISTWENLWAIAIAMWQRLKLELGLRLWHCRTETMSGACQIVVRRKNAACVAKWQSRRQSTSATAAAAAKKMKIYCQKMKESLEC